MKLIIIIIALIALRYIHIGRTEHRYNWLLYYAQSVTGWLQGKKLHNPIITLILLMIPIVLVIYGLKALLSVWVFGLVGFILNLAFFWFALWPVSATQLDAEGFNHHDDIKEDVPKLIVQPDTIVGATIAEQRSRDYSKKLLIEANQNTFAVIFWFLVFGVYGAILYRFINLLYRHARDSDDSLTSLFPLLKLFEQALDWIPIRFVALGYTLAGDFVKSFYYWRRYAGRALESNDDMLTMTGLAAAGKDPGDARMADLEENLQLIRLIDRTLIIWLFLIAISIIGILVY